MHDERSCSLQRPPRPGRDLGIARPVLFVPNPKAAERFFELFTANIRERPCARMTKADTHR